MRLYCSSNIQGLKEINPSKDNKIYAYTDRRFAACFGAIWNYDDANLIQSDYEVFKFGILNPVDLNQPCSIYEVDCNNFIPLVSLKKYISKYPVKVIREVKYNSFKDMLLDNNVGIISYDDYKSNLFNMFDYHNLFLKFYYVVSIYF